MWLSKEKQILLVHYAKKGVVGSGLSFEMNEAIDWLHRERVKNADPRLVYEANNASRRYELLMECGRPGSCNDKRIIITLSQKGYDLGRKYNTKIGIFQIWCREYMWLIVLLTGVISALTLLVTIIRN